MNRRGYQNLKPYQNQGPRQPQQLMPSQQPLQTLIPVRQTQQAQQKQLYAFQKLQRPLEEGECLCKGAWENLRPDNQAINNYFVAPPYNMTEYITKHGESPAPTGVDIYICKVSFGCCMPGWNRQNRPEALFLPWEELKAIEFSYLHGDIILLVGVGIEIYFHIHGSMANFMAPFMAKYATRRYCYWQDHYTLGLNQNAFRRSNSGLKIQLSGEDINGWLKATVTYEDQVPECPRIQQHLAPMSGGYWETFDPAIHKFQEDDDYIPQPGDPNSIRAQIQSAKKSSTPSRLSNLNFSNLNFFSTPPKQTYAYVRFARLPMNYRLFDFTSPRFIPWADVDGIEFSYRYKNCLLLWGADLEVYLHIPSEMIKFFSKRRFQEAIEWTTDFSLVMNQNVAHYHFGLKFQLIEQTVNAVYSWTEVLISHEKIPKY